MTTDPAELPPSSALALPIVITIPSNRNTPAEPGQLLSTVLLQIGHRIGVVALLALIGAIYAACTGHEFYLPLAIAAGCADVGLCAALIVLSRFVLVALLAAVAIAGMVWLSLESQGYWAILAGLIGAILCLAVRLLASDRPAPRVRRELVGLLSFNGCVFLACILFMLVARLHVMGDSIRETGADVRSDVQDFFTAPPTVPTQP